MMGPRRVRPADPWKEQPLEERGEERTSVLRPVLHAATGLCALLLGVLPPWAALAAAGGGMLAGWVVLPLTPLEARLRRPGEPFLCGLRTYPLAVLGLVLWLGPAEAAAAWGVLAFGDAAASLVGVRVPAPRVLGSRKATWSGSLAHVAVGALAAWGLAAGVAGLAAWSGAVAPGPVPGVAACLLAGAAAALADLLLLPPDDNLPGAAAAALGLLLARSLF
jgi:dolichol kinase